MEIVIPCIYEGAYPFREDRAIVTNEQGETLAIDSNNKTIFKFDKAPSTGYYSDGHILQDCCGVYKDKYGKTSLNINKFYYVVTYFGKSRIIRADSTEELEKKVEVIINEIRAYYNDIINSIDKTQNTLNKKGINPPSLSDSLFEPPFLLPLWAAFIPSGLKFVFFNFSKALFNLLDNSIISLEVCSCVKD